MANQALQLRLRLLEPSTQAHETRRPLRRAAVVAFPRRGVSVLPLPALWRHLAAALEKPLAGQTAGAVRGLPFSALEYSPQKPPWPRPAALRLITHFGRGGTNHAAFPAVPNPKHVPSVKSLAAEVARLRDLVVSLANTPRLHRKDLMARYGIAEATLHRWLRRGRLPRPVRFCGPLWRLADLEAAEQAGELPHLGGA